MEVLGQTHTNRFQLHLHLRFLRHVQQMDAVQLSGAVQLRWRVRQMEMNATAEDAAQFADLGCFTGVGRPVQQMEMTAIAEEAVQLADLGCFIGVARQANLSQIARLKRNT